jgi:hypothetical protein
MAQLKYFTDKHIPKAVIDQLRNRGVDVLRCEDVDMDTASDQELLEFAAQEQRAIVTFDEDFLRLHHEWQQSGKRHTGIFRFGRYLQGEKNFGRLVTELFDYFQLIEKGAGSIEDDIESHQFLIN